MCMLEEALPKNKREVRSETLPVRRPDAHHTVVGNSVVLCPDMTAYYGAHECKLEDIFRGL